MLGPHLPICIQEAKARVDGWMRRKSLKTILQGSRWRNSGTTKCQAQRWRTRAEIAARQGLPHRLGKASRVKVLGAHASIGAGTFRPSDAVPADVPRYRNPLVRDHGASPTLCAGVEHSGRSASVSEFHFAFSVIAVRKFVPAGPFAFAGSWRTVHRRP